MTSSKSTQKKIIFETLAVVVGLAIAFIPAPEGLQQNAMWTMGLLLWAIINWVTKVIPDFVCVFIM